MSQVLHSDVRKLRAQVVLTLVTCFLVCGALWAFLLRPVQEEVRSCRKEILSVEDELSTFRLRMEDGGLAERLSEAKLRNRQLVAEWDELRSRVDTFGDDKALRDTLPAYDDGRIDFKVALFNARDQLLDDAAKANVEMPEDLGVPETIGT